MTIAQLPLQNDHSSSSPMLYLWLEDCATLLLILGKDEQSNLIIYYQSIKYTV